MKSPNIRLAAMAAGMWVSLGMPPAAMAAPHASPAAVDAASSEAAGKAARLDHLYDEYWEVLLKREPLTATFLGDSRYNNLLPNTYTAEYRAETLAFLKSWRGRVAAVGESGLSGQDLISYRLFLEEMDQRIEGQRFNDWQQPFSQFGNPATNLASLGSGVSSQPFKTVADYDNWRSRAANIPVIFRQLEQNARTGMVNGIVQPKALMLKVVDQLNQHVVGKAEDSVFWRPVRNMPKSIDPKDRKRIEAEYRQMIEQTIVPAYAQLRNFIAKEYVPAARSTSGLSALPGGTEWYAFKARSSTTTDLTPDEIHAIGLKEVDRIHGEIREVMKQTGFQGPMHDFFKYVQEDKRFRYASEADVLGNFNAIRKVVDGHVGTLFSIKPKAAFEIRPFEAFQAKSAPSAAYVEPSADGTRPGVFYVNTSNLSVLYRWDAESLYLHEAIPGHHYQVGLQQELSSLPKFRRFGGETSYAEGWALYAESLGRDMGLYRDPYNYFGRLQNELWRAIRLVVDTGLHRKGWTREQVIKYMLDNSAESEANAIVETERYMAIPGQALAYKIGEMKFRQLRAKAQKELGPKFDIRAFHACVLEDGAVPLDALETIVDAWIEKTKHSS
ncbi:DUF885 domain-containing protein [Rhodanobacter sp. PCA2]|uniref:DUF885 domain-containing protein n=1 Tax=Rhodanobacter sp. PCA2 TaxID=2006117 RepID=UPI0015E6B483|nr:DUF885 domain-containing protein [Rhodanobacter sp. PCA2]MBA2078011.1 DUF885 domain-containing protein [Rhodanobacter sp. PCA2]